jgi:branched-chain amino acid transport system ATP-binding protein
MVLLEVQGLKKVFGGLTAVNELDFSIYEGEILGIIGPNGAGKTTVLNMITGFLRPTKGKVFFKEQDITYLRPHRIAAKGVIRSFQANNLFKEMTVFDNLVVAQHLIEQNEGSLGSNTDTVDTQQKIIKLLDYMDLTSFKNELSKNLPHGHQRALGIAIALSANPKLLLLDEPLTGMVMQEAFAITKRIKGLRERGITMAIVEHNVRAIMALCDRIVVMNFGRKIAEGSPQEIQNNKDVIEAYLGSS